MTKNPDTRGQVQITDPAVMDALRAAAAERLVSVSWLSTRLIREALTRLIPVDQLYLTRDAPTPLTLKTPSDYVPSYDDGAGPPRVQIPGPRGSSGQDNPGRRVDGLGRPFRV